MSSTTTVTRQYRLQLSFEDYNADHDYQRGDYNNVPKNDNNDITSLAEAVQITADYYSSDSSLSWIAYWIQETVTTKTVEVVGKQTTTTSVKVTTEDAHVEYRSAEDYEEYVAKPSREWLANRIASGEVALHNAYMKEIEENSYRVENGETLVYGAKIAYNDFMGYPVSDFMRRDEAARVKREERRSVSKSFFRRAKDTRSA